MIFQFQNIIIHNVQFSSMSNFSGISYFLTFIRFDAEVAGLELSTSRLGSERSTSELLRPVHLKIRDFKLMTSVNDERG